MSREDRDPKLEVKEHTMILDDGKKHWKEVVEDHYKYKGKDHDPRLEVYMK